MGTPTPSTTSSNSLTPHCIHPPRTPRKFTMNKLLLLFAVVVAAAAMPVDSESNLLKRLLEVLKEKPEEKRTTNYISYNSNTGKLMVSYVARYGVTGVDKHVAHVTDSSDNKVADFSSTKYAAANGGGFTDTYELTGLTSDATYNVEACEVTNDNEDYCNTRTFTA